MAQAGRSSVPSSSSSVSTSLLFSLSQRADGSRTAQYSFSKAVLVSQAGGSRVLSYCEPLSCLLASQPSPQATLVPGEMPFFLPFVQLAVWPKDGSIVHSICKCSTLDQSKISRQIDVKLEVWSHYTSMTDWFKHLSPILVKSQTTFISQSWHLFFTWSWQMSSGWLRKDWCLMSLEI